MPIDPATGLDPETGLMGLKETHQPTGAIGAVMSYLNADKSRQISQALQQHRAASAQMEQQQADEYAARQARDDQVRQAIAKLGDNPSQQNLIGTYLKSGGDVERVLPWMRAQTSASAKVDAARVKSGMELYGNLTVKGGQPPNQALTMMAGVYSPEELDAIKAQLGGAGDLSLPNPAAKQMKDTAGAELDRTKGEDLVATRDSRIALNKSKAETDRLVKQAALERAKRGGTRQRSTTLAIEGQVARLGKYINDAMEKVDPLTFKRGPKDMTEVNEWKAQKARLEEELAEAGEGDDDADETSQAVVNKPGASKGSPNPFGDLPGWMGGKKAPKPAGGSTTAAGGTSSPNPGDRLDLLK